MKLNRWRRLCQASAICLVILIPFLNKKGYTWVSGTLYSLSIGPLWITDPLIGLQTALTSWRVDLLLFLSVLTPILAALLLGRVFCGWVCPQNTISEAVDLAAGTIGIKRLFTIKPTASYRYAFLLLILVVTTLVGLPLASLLSAPGIISVQAAKLVYEGTVGLELGLIGVIIVAELFLARRIWCNHLCPVGSFLGLFRWRKTLKVVLAEDTEHPCGHCLACAKACQLGLNPLQEKIYPQCHNCGACLDACRKLNGNNKPLIFRFWEKKEPSNPSLRRLFL